ncbi:D-alanyl-D-alanine carboxypeptidase [Phyllobacterium phragmitis]|uniref:D-alanyl-D-alanine carboxypeptidase n=1 Tax=Phyllobacterium phragmitis TaxID=2670329 RepID=A0A2S9IMG3_9HYPH|nr:D-alanyl-D-alanine carboxypeptidase family protein [Phyllobacterium phragmitis]PRD41718.1 D-alanyl-D-alanine carboxypeptidase [Phyllobacterium phragmitis]
MKKLVGLSTSWLKFALGVSIVFVLCSASASPVQANAKYAGIVIDAKTGKTLYRNHADSARYPASLTKMMTLYLVFDALESGKISKRTKIPVSRHAARQVPSKLGLRPGQTITVEQVILALVTKSANDAATAIGEFLGGSEAGFARMMTQKARQLGMNSTTFRNANGLPDRRQKTTARDMARLGLALRDHHPRYYSYFTTRSFKYRGRRFGNHNNLLGRVKGVDGIKTGYTRASGFNLVSSVEARGRSIVSVVMGGRTSRSRDAQMRKLISRYLPKASRGPDRFRIDRGGESALVAFALPKTMIPVPAQNPARADDSRAVLVAAATDDMAVGQQVGSSDAVDPINTASTHKGEWVIQVGSLPSEAAAREVLSRAARKAPKMLADASALVEPFRKDGNVYYRARYASFDSKSEAWRTCKRLARKDIDCYAVIQ